MTGSTLRFDKQRTEVGVGSKRFIENKKRNPVFGQRTARLRGIGIRTNFGRSRLLTIAVLPLKMAFLANNAYFWNVNP
jgi:hypothetical protein